MDELKKEDKFIVINWKRLEELSETGHQGYLSAEGFRRELGKFVTRYEQRTGKTMDQQYIVCNQDEPYAEKVWDLILNRPETSTDKCEQYETLLPQASKLIHNFYAGLGWEHEEQGKRLLKDIDAVLSATLPDKSGRSYQENGGKEG